MSAPRSLSKSKGVNLDFFELVVAFFATFWRRQVLGSSGLKQNWKKLQLVGKEHLPPSLICQVLKKLKICSFFSKSIPTQWWMAVWSRSVRSTTNIVSIDNNIGLWTRPLSITFDFWKIINTTVTEHLSLIPLSKLSWKWWCTKVNLCPKPDIFHFWNSHHRFEKQFTFNIYQIHQT